MNHIELVNHLGSWKPFYLSQYKVGKHWHYRMKCSQCFSVFGIDYSQLKVALSKGLPCKCSSCKGHVRTTEEWKGMLSEVYQEALVRVQTVRIPNGHTRTEGVFLCSNCGCEYTVRLSNFISNHRKCVSSLCGPCARGLYGLESKQRPTSLAQAFRNNSITYWREKLGVDEDWFQGKDCHHVIPYGLCLIKGWDEYLASPTNSIFLTRDKHLRVHTRLSSGSPFLFDDYLVSCLTAPVPTIDASVLLAISKSFL